ncbi:uncharacterized protein C8R40DRAFT_1082747, partial [Lentinula edodes]|uniref:uncharacterized protein n=1 Tax=Lentinula edodes TaxID=5353 RepID=UPI001E8CEE49
QNPALSSFSISAAFRHPVKQDEITIPRSLLYIIVSSIFISFLLLIFSLLDLGYFSLWLTPALCLFTLLYFTGVYVLSRMERRIEEPTYFPMVVFVGYIMTIIWLVSFILTVVVFAAYPHMVDVLRQQGLHIASVGLQSHVIAMEEGDPENWRILIGKTQNLAANVSLAISPSRIIFTNVLNPFNLNDPSMIQEPREAAAPTIQPDWITAAVLEDNMTVAPRTPKPPTSPCPQIEIFSPGPMDDLYDDAYISDYHREEVPEHQVSPGAPHISPRGKPNSEYSEKEHFERAYFPRLSVFSPRLVHLPPSPLPSSSYHSHTTRSDTDDDSETPETPDRWSDEDEVEEEYHAAHLRY